MGDSFIITRVFSNGQLQTVFQREFKIEPEHEDKRLCLVASGLQISSTWVSKGALDAAFSAQSFCGRHCHSPPVPVSLPPQASSLSLCKDGVSHFFSLRQQEVTSQGDD